MKKVGINIALVALLAGVAGISTPSRAETGQVAVIFTKGGLIVGVGGGEGVLVLRGHRYPFTVFRHECWFHDRRLDHQARRTSSQSERAGLN